MNCFAIPAPRNKLISIQKIKKPSFTGSDAYSRIKTPFPFSTGKLNKCSDSFLLKVNDPKFKISKLHVNLNLYNYSNTTFKI